MSENGVPHGALRPECLTLAVYAPFGSDQALSDFPGDQPLDITKHPLVQYLQRVARLGVRVVALVDLYDRDTWLVTIPPDRPLEASFVAKGKLQMDAPATLTELILTARRDAPGNELVLTIEGHGAGFMPDLDQRLLTLTNETAGGEVQWKLGTLTDDTIGSQPQTADGEPLIKAGAPVLPVVGPTCPTNHSVISTWGLGAALAAGQPEGARRIRVIHIDTCFNMAAEVLHTIAPYAHYATAYCNYNFFSAGEAYPLVFERLASQGSATDEELARWFAAANHTILCEAGHEPTVAGTVELGRMAGIVEKIDEFSDALLSCLKDSTPADRAIYLDRIQAAIVAAQQYDSRPDYILETPDELTDLDSLAFEIMKVDLGSYGVGAAAQALRDSLRGIKQYGDVGTPWMAPTDLWDFSSKNLAMSIFLPDPLRNGLWDWRSQYYLDVNPSPLKPQVQRHIIPFIRECDWAEFLIEYHRDTPFIGLLPALVPDIPVLQSNFDPRHPNQPAQLRPATPASGRIG